MIARQARAECRVKVTAKMNYRAFLGGRDRFGDVGDPVESRQGLVLSLQQSNCIVHFGGRELGVEHE